MGAFMKYKHQFNAYVPDHPFLYHKLANVYECLGDYEKISE